MIEKSLLAKINLSMLAILSSLLLQSCGSIAKHVDINGPMSDRVTAIDKIPPPYCATVDDIDATWGCLSAPFCYDDEDSDVEWWYVFLTPLPLVDFAPSFCLDTLLSPMDISNYYSMPEKNRGRKPAIVVVKATYGTKGKQIDVTDKLNTMVKNNKLDFVVDDATLGEVASDSKHPAKFLNIEYSYRGGWTRTKYKEKQHVKLPPPKSKSQ